MKGLAPKSFFTRGSEFSSLKATEPNLSVRKHARLLAALFLVMIVALLLLPWQQTAVGKGTAIAYSPSDREQEIHASVTGRIASWFVSEGQAVEKGDVLVELRDIDPMLLERLNLERDAMHRRSEAASKAVQTAKRNMERQKALLQQGLSSRRDFEKAELDYMGYLAEEAEANATVARMDVKLARQLTQRIEAPAKGTILKIHAGQGGRL